MAHAGAPCPAPLKQWAIDHFPDGSVWEFYGSTEGQFTACPARGWLDRRAPSAGPGPAGALSVDDDGTIWCTVPDHARFTYWRDPEATARAWRGDAFTVGDLGRLDDDGYLYLDGRRDDLIITGGVNVYPVEVEQALHELDGVEEVAVFGVPDERGASGCAPRSVGAAHAEAGPGPRPRAAGGLQVPEGGLRRGRRCPTRPRASSAASTWPDRFSG